MNFSPQTLTLTSLLLALLSLLYSVYLHLQVRQLKKLTKVFLTGKNGSDLETVLYALSTELNAQQQHQMAAEEAIAALQHDLRFTVQKIGVVRFNPFGDGGGNFSFTAALLDANNTGLIVTSLYGREQNRMYAKHIENGQSESQLTEEEQQAIHMANSK